MRFEKLRYSRIMLIVLTMLNVLIIILRNRVRSDIILGEGFVIPASGINGSIAALVFFIAILLTFVDNKWGMWIGIFNIFISSVGAALSIIASRNFASNPGVINAVIFIIALLVISAQIKRSDNFAITDHVTGLKNRYGFEYDFMKKRIKKGSYIAYIHLMGMGKINTNMGRSYFDECMSIIANRIVEVLGKSGKVYKLEGVDYAVVIPKGEDYIGLIDKILDSIEEKLELEKKNITVNCYVDAVAGVVNSTGDDSVENFREIMRFADIAMNKAIRDNNNRICEFSNEIRVQIERENEVEGIIKHALTNNLFFLEYQPQYLISSGKLRGFESLLRLQLEDGTRISPGEFVPVAEKSDLIIDIDKYVLRLAMKQFVGILNTTGADAYVSVNVSAKDISTPGFADEVKQMLDETGFPARCLEIEITEYSLAESMQNTLDNIYQLRSNDVKIALDDFGTGYTSLAQLINLPIDLLKIDKSLIDNVENSAQNRDFISAVIYMGHLMNCEVISEGVESEGQLDILKWLECDFVQGFVKNKPLPFEQAVEIVKWSNSIY